MCVTIYIYICTHSLSTGVMKKIALTVAFCMLSVPCLRAQDEITLSYGCVSVPCFAYTFASTFATVLTFGLIEPENFHSTGVVSAGYWHNFSPRFSVGGSLAYENFRMNFNQYAGKDENGQTIRELSGWDRISFTSLMPGIRYRWVNREHFGMFTRANAGGIWYHNREIDVQADEDHRETHPAGDDFGFAFQLSLIGIEMGKGHWRCMAEIGWGMEGFATAGVKYIL